MASHTELAGQGVGGGGLTSGRAGAGRLPQPWVLASPGRGWACPEGGWTSAMEEGPPPGVQEGTEGPWSDVKPPAHTRAPLESCRCLGPTPGVRRATPHPEPGFLRHGSGCPGVRPSLLRSSQQFRAGACSFSRRHLVCLLSPEGQLGREIRSAGSVSQVPALSGDKPSLSLSPPV